MFRFMIFLAMSSVTHAAVTLVEKDDWKVQMSGFVETDIFHDNTRALTEVAGNSPISRSGTASRENGQTVFSIRNSRIAFTILPPLQDEFKSKGYLEYDLLGYDPKPASSGTTNSESGYYTNPTLRVRHAYFSSERNSWTWLVGQTWTLFGWQPNYVLTTASVPPGPGVLYQRTVQAMAMKTVDAGPGKLQLAASLARPSQRDSEVPNVDAGARWALARVASGMASPSGDVKLESLSVGISGTWRQFVSPEDATATSKLKKHAGQAGALDLLIPILPAKEGSVANTLTLTAEFSGGTGFGDEFPGWTGNLQQFPQATPTSASNLNLDAGQGGYDGSGAYRLLRLQAWNAQLQYHLAGDKRTFVTAGYGQLTASRIGEMTTVSGTAYDKSSMMFLNVFHDCTKQIRVAAEFAKFSTHYVDGQTASDERLQLNGYFRF